MRLTCDLDDPTLFQIVRSWKRMEEVGTGEVRGRLSNSGNGVHLETAGVDTTDPIAEELRRYVNDDPWRIALDKQQDWRPSQVLYDSPHPWVDMLPCLLNDYQKETGRVA